MKRGQTATHGEGSTQRYRKRYDEIVDAASALINSVGAHAMTFADVAIAVGLNTTSITYYFKRKEQLALACYDRAIARYEGFVAQAEAQETTEARIRTLLSCAFANLRAIRDGTAAPHAVLSEIRTLDDSAKQEALAAYARLFRRTRALFGTTADPLAHSWLTARTHMLLDNLFWLPFWIDRYDPDDFGRVEQRMADLLIHGFAGPGGTWSVSAPPEPDMAQDSGEAIFISHDDFLRAATGLINERSYHGASVERIAAQLNVTKGSFYHHLDTKDALVLTCFARSFAIIADTQRASAATTGLMAVCGSITALLYRQFAGGDTLLRTTALQALPQQVRVEMIDDANRLARRYAGMLSDGIIDGSIRAVDPLIAAQMILSTVDSAYDMRWWAARQPMEDAVRTCIASLLYGIAAPVGDRLPSMGSRR